MKGCIIDKECINRTKELIEETNKNNFTLIHRNNKNIIEKKSIDFIYSFIVFQHFANIDQIIEYIDYSKEILTQNGCGIFYFGRNDKNNNDYISMSKLENERGCALFLNKNYAKTLIEKHFKIIEIDEVTKKPWDGKKSGQFFIKFINKGGN